MPINPNTNDLNFDSLMMLLLKILSQNLGNLPATREAYVQQVMAPLEIQGKGAVSQILANAVSRGVAQSNIPSLLQAGVHQDLLRRRQQAEREAIDYITQLTQQNLATVLPVLASLLTQKTQLPLQERELGLREKEIGLREIGQKFTQGLESRRQALEEQRNLGRVAGINYVLGGTQTNFPVLNALLQSQSIMNLGRQNIANFLSNTALQQMLLARRFGLR